MKQNAAPAAQPFEHDLYEKLSTLNEYHSVWKTLKPKQRLKQLKKLQKEIASQAETLAKKIGEITRRPSFEVMSQEILPVLEMSRFCNRNMAGWLKPKHKRYLRPGFASTKLIQTFEPYGTVAIVMPSNFPFSLGLMSTFYLAAAGNSVLLKPSEKFPEISQKFQEILQKSGLLNRVISIVEGGPDSVHTLIDSGEINKLFFFGSCTSGTEIRRHCFEQNVPCVLETGGGTAAVVDTGVSLKRTAKGIAWSAFYTRGLSCIGTRYVFVKRKFKNAFLKQLRLEAGRLYGEYDSTFSLHPDTINKIHASLGHGANLYSIYSEYGSTIPKNGTPHIEPGILEVYPDDAILQQELFDPILVLCTIDQLSEAVPLINKAHNLIGASVWTSNRKRARKLISQLHTSMNWINDASFGLPNLPWGSRNIQSQGMLFSRDALHEAGQWKWIVDSPGQIPRFWWHPYTKFKRKVLKLLTKMY